MFNEDTARIPSKIARDTSVKVGMLEWKRGPLRERLTGSAAIVMVIPSSPLCLLARSHVDLLDKNNQLILELKHLDSTQTQRYSSPLIYTAPLLL